MSSRDDAERDTEEERRKEEEEEAFFLFILLYFDSFKYLEAYLNTNWLHFIQHC